MPMFKIGATVRQVPRVIEGPVTKREIVDETIVYFVHDAATDHEIPIAEGALELVSEPEADHGEPAAPGV